MSTLDNNKKIDFEVHITYRILDRVTYLNFKNRYVICSKTDLTLKKKSWTKRDFANKVWLHFDATFIGKHSSFFSCYHSQGLYIY